MNKLVLFLVILLAYGLRELLLSFGADGDLVALGIAVIAYVLYLAKIPIVDRQTMSGADAVLGIPVAGLAIVLGLKHSGTLAISSTIIWVMFAMLAIICLGFAFRRNTAERRDR